MSAWDKTKHGSKAAFDKAWAGFEKLGVPVNKFTNKIGSEAFWPTTLDHESDKAARILKSFCSKFPSSHQVDQLTITRGWILQRRARLANFKRAEEQTQSSCQNTSESDSKLCRPRNIHCHANWIVGFWSRRFRCFDCEESRRHVVASFRYSHPHLGSWLHGWNRHL